MRKILFYISLFVLIFSVNILSAQEDPINEGDGPPPRHEFDGPRGGRGPHGMEPLGDREYLKDELKLSDDQIDRITKINDDFRAQFIKYREVLRPERRKLMGMLLKDNVNLDEVRAQLKKIGDMQVDVHMTKIKQRLAIEKVLTPEQKEKHRNEMKQRRKMRRHDR